MQGLELGTSTKKAGISFSDRVCPSKLFPPSYVAFPTWDAQWFEGYLPKQHQASLSGDILSQRYRSFSTSAMRQEEGPSSDFCNTTHSGISFPPSRLEPN